jgi:hypothetical protein
MQVSSDSPASPAKMSNAGSSQRQSKRDAGEERAASREEYQGQRVLSLSFVRSPRRSSILCFVKSNVWTNLTLTCPQQSNSVHISLITSSHTTGVHGTQTTHSLVLRKDERTPRFFASEPPLPLRLCIASPTNCISLENFSLLYS